MSEPLLIEQRAAVLWLSLNRPHAHHALNRELSTALVEALHAAAHDNRIRVVILSSSGEKTFCAGADLKESGSASPFTTNNQENPLVSLFRAIRACPKPVVGRIAGSAWGGGLGLVAACDLVYAADDVHFGTPEVKVGVFPMMITTYLMRQLPQRRYWEMAYLGEPLNAHEAQQYHLINRAVPRAELDNQIQRVTERLLANAPTALSLGKQALGVMQDMSIEQSFAYAALMIEKLAASDDAQEGKAAFVEKRQPRWG